MGVLYVSTSRRWRISVSLLAMARGGFTRTYIRHPLVVQMDLTNASDTNSRTTKSPLVHVTQTCPEGWLRIDFKENRRDGVRCR